MKRFKNRKEAGIVLAEALSVRDYQRPIVLGIPRGGVSVAAEVARRLGGSLGVVVARKLRAPGQPELAIGAVASDGSSWINDVLAENVGVDPEYLEHEQALQAAEARKREEAFDGHRRPMVAGRTVLIVDDGLATGSTATAAARSMRAAGAGRVVLAIPVAPPESVRRLAEEVDEVVCPRIEEDFWAVGQFYEDFRQVSDDEVRALLDSFEGEPTTVVATVPRDHETLAVRLNAPSPGAPLVTFVHGLGSSKDSPRNVVIAERLHDLGMATLLFDLSGHGDSTGAPTHDIDAYVRDLAAVDAWAMRQSRVDRSLHAVAGSSLGATVALRALLSGRVQASTLVLRAPPINPESYAGLTTPTLVIVGSHDPLLAEATAAARRFSAIELRVVEGAGHLFEEEGTLEEATRHTAEWLVEHLQPVERAVPAVANAT